MDIEHYGESLESHPDFFFMKKMWEEDLENLQNVQENTIFVDPPNIISKKIFAGVNFTITRETDEEDILRSSLGTSHKREDGRQMDLRGETAI